jgi:hypothetical protein
MPQKFGSVALRSNMPLSPAERARRYRQGLRELSRPRRRLPIKITDQIIKSLVKRRYLGPQECEDSTAIWQAGELGYLGRAGEVTQAMKNEKKR